MEQRSILSNRSLFTNAKLKDITHTRSSIIFFSSTFYETTPINGNHNPHTL